MMSEQPTESKKRGLSAEERQQVRDLIRFLVIVLVFVILAALVMGFIVTNFL